MDRRKKAVGHEGIVGKDDRCQVALCVVTTAFIVGQGHRRSRRIFRLLCWMRICRRDGMNWRCGFPPPPTRRVRGMRCAWLTCCSMEAPNGAAATRVYYEPDRKSTRLNSSHLGI